METATSPAIAIKDLPAIGAELHGGAYAGVSCNAAGELHAVVLLADKPDSKLNWAAAVAWAEGLGAQLPTRAAAATLFQTSRDAFEHVWHWTCESHADDGECAWNQYFSYGSQSHGRKSYEGRARAVRMIPLSTSVLQATPASNTSSTPATSDAPHDEFDPAAGLLVVHKADHRPGRWH